MTKTVFLFIAFLAFHANCTAQYVHPWPMENVQVRQEHNSNTKDEDTLSWETIADIEFVYAKAVGNSQARYTLDIELLDNGGFLVPWCDFDNGFYITELDSNANEVYTNHYPGYFSVKLDLYREGNMLYMLGKYRDGEEAQSPYYATLIKYDLVNRDTVFSKKIFRLPDINADPPRSIIGADSVFYFVAGIVYPEEYIYKINKNGDCLDSIPLNIEVRNLHLKDNNIYISASNGSLYRLYESGIEFVWEFEEDNIAAAFLDNNDLYSIEKDDNYRYIKKYNWLGNSVFDAFTTYPIANYGDNLFAVASNGCLLVGNTMYVGVYWPPEEMFNYALVKLSPNGEWLHKLYIGGVDQEDCSFYLLNNGDYLLIGNANGNPQGDGNIFFTRIKPWHDGIGIDQVMNNNDQLSIFPNPVADVVTIQFPACNEGTLYITNLQGTIQFTQNTTKRQTNMKTNLAHLAPGMYIVRYKSREKVFTTKFIKQ